MRFAVLLRGVNVGGVTIRMAELRELLERAGFGEVRTLLASGNVLLSSDEGAAAVKATVEGLLRERFGYEAWVLVYDLAQLQDIAGGYPWPRRDDTHHPYVLFSEDGASAAELAATDGLDPDEERVQLGPHGVLYWEVLRSRTVDSVIGKASARARYKPTTTTRNLRTVEKLLG